MRKQELMMYKDRGSDVRKWQQTDCRGQTQTDNGDLPCLRCMRTAMVRGGDGHDREDSCNDVDNDLQILEAVHHIRHVHHMNTGCPSSE